MELSKGTLISAAIILLTVVVGGFLLVAKKDSFFSQKSGTSSVSSVQLKFGEKSYKLNYSSLATDFVTNIANFEQYEDWQGPHDFDTDIFWEGDSSLVVTSKNNEKVDNYIEKTLNLDRYQIFNMVVYLQTEPADREEARLYFANKNKTAYYVYPLTNLAAGWNYIRIPKIKFSSVNAVKVDLINSQDDKNEATTAAVKGAGLLNWDKIERVGVEVVSRPNSTTTVNFDSLTALESEEYLDGWLTGNSSFLDLVKNKDEKITLQAKNIGPYLAVIKKITGVSDFTFQTKAQPIKVNARSGIFFRGDYKTGNGYFFLIDGVDGNRWQIHKTGLVDKKTTTTVLKSGIINNFVVEKNKPLWLRIVAKGSNLKLYLSTDNNSYTQLGEVDDKEFKEGAIGITVFDGGVTQFTDFEFNQ